MTTGIGCKRAEGQGQTAVHESTLPHCSVIDTAHAAKASDPATMEKERDRQRKIKKKGEQERFIIEE